MYHKIVNFAEWIDRELRERNWTRIEAARRAGISHSMFDKVINGRAEPGPKFFEGIARAFKMSPEEVYRAAGVFPARSPEDEKLIEQIISLTKGLSEESKQNLYEYTRMLRRLEEERASKYDAKHKPRQAGT